MAAVDTHTKSKVFIKRNFLFSELKQVLISVEQCASLWLLEDFLRTKIKSQTDVKVLKVPQQPSGILSQTQKTNSSKQSREIVEKAMIKMKEIISKPSGDRIRSESEEFSQLIADELVNS